MNYYIYTVKCKIKEIFYKSIFKIGFIKKWYIGNEFLKNPPVIKTKVGAVTEGMEFTNVTFIPDMDNKIVNCTFINTLKLRQYF